ncbi:hypothetical protein N24_0379 [Corynebacterium suranareeae]|uniref:Secreted protein n=1 Tax=Corynebacterium suranareeae TaxID=2506452 RepID=A0A160PPR8_9CORY|nr:hypothetical protein [Corynebacterium suranareeae]BAU94641.1 hypothetical protein N24_0379 [Corynebacterium suranareeae]
MRFKSVAAIVLSTAVIMGATASVANAQQVSPSSMIEIPQEFVQTVQNFVPGISYADAESAIQSTAGSVALNSTASIILPIVLPFLGLGAIGSAALSA